MLLAAFNEATGDDITPDLLACCDVPSWASAVIDGRPYADLPALFAAADAAAKDFGPGDVERALAAHPRIGQRASGADTGAAWSRQEQSGVSTDESIQQALATGNEAYEQRFGRVFLICATGLTGEQILDALRTRLANQPDAENAVVADELRKIAVLRLMKLVTP